MKKQYYKYRPLYLPGNGHGKTFHPFTKSIFSKAELYFGAPMDFNDPFDCNLRTHVDDSSDAEWEAHIDYLMASNAITTASRAKLRQIKTDRSWKTIPDLANVGVDAQRIHYEKSSVLCLAKKGNSIPMFSYYADSHQGIAIEFSFPDHEVPCGFPFQPSAGGPLYGGKVVFRDVEYPTTFPELNYHRIRNTDMLVRHLIFTKSPEWSHEQEFRIFRRKVPKSSVTFDRSQLTRVVFGCKTQLADILMVKGWLAGWPSDVVLSRAEPAKDRFELDVTDFEVIKGIPRKKLHVPRQNRRPTARAKSSRVVRGVLGGRGIVVGKKPNR